MMQVKRYLSGMLGRRYEKQECSAAKALELVGERWSLLILRDAMFASLTRFSQFQKSLGIATNVLAKRLDDFVAYGLMERRQQASTGEQVEYLLSQKGLELKPVVVALTEWGDKWICPGPIVFESRNDRQPVALRLLGTEDAAEVPIADVVARPRGAAKT